MKLYYYGKSYGRFDDQVVKGEIDTTDIVMLRSMDEDDEAYDLYIDKLMDNEGYDYMAAVSGIVQELDPVDIDAILSSKPRGILLEELEYGVGPTKSAAKCAFAEIGDDSGEW